MSILYHSTEKQRDLYSVCSDVHRYRQIGAGVGYWPFDVIMADHPKSVPHSCLLPIPLDVGAEIRKANIILPIIA